MLMCIIESDAIVGFAISKMEHSSNRTIILWKSKLGRLIGNQITEQMNDEIKA